MGRIFVAGSINMDITMQVERRPQPGETVVGEDVDFVLGGKGTNQAVSAARLDALTQMVGRVGDDNFGEELMSRLAAEDVQMEHVQEVQDTPSGMATITVDASSENSIVIIPGANATVSPEDVATLDISAEDVAISQFEIPQSTIRAFFKRAQDKDATTILNPAPASEFHESILPLVDYLIVNETEALFYSDSDDTSETALAETCENLRSHEAQTIIVTLGEEGVFASTPNETVSIDSCVVDPIDTTGAGDAFVGAFATTISEGADTVEALEFANAAGAAATTVVGATPSLPTREDIRRIRSSQ